MAKDGLTADVIRTRLAEVVTEIEFLSEKQIALQKILAGYQHLLALREKEEAAKRAQIAPAAPSHPDPSARPSDADAAL